MMGDMEKLKKKAERKELFQEARLSIVFTAVFTALLLFVTSMAVGELLVMHNGNMILAKRSTNGGGSVAIPGEAGKNYYVSLNGTIPKVEKDGETVKVYYYPDKPWDAQPQTDPRFWIFSYAFLGLLDAWAIRGLMKTFFPKKHKMREDIVAGDNVTGGNRFD